MIEPELAPGFLTAAQVEAARRMLDAQRARPSPSAPFRDLPGELAR